MLTGDTAKARRLRKAMSLPEVLLWRALKDRPLGMKFRRQQPAGAYVLDFYCAPARLCVEVDGALAHAGERAAAHDVERDRWLAARGIATFRVAAAEVLRDAAAVADGLARLADARMAGGPSALRAPPRAGEDFL